jgi:hypothetical protein
MPGSIQLLVSYCSMGLSMCRRCPLAANKEKIKGIEPGFISDPCPFYFSANVGFDTASCLLARNDWKGIKEWTTQKEPQHSWAQLWPWLTWRGWVEWTSRSVCAWGEPASLPWPRWGIHTSPCTCVIAYPWLPSSYAKKTKKKKKQNRSAALAKTKKVLVNWLSGGCWMRGQKKGWSWGHPGSFLGKSWPPRPLAARLSEECAWFSLRKILGFWGAVFSADWAICAGPRPLHPSLQVSC